jgi:hypothetical protein
LKTALWAGILGAAVLWPGRLAGPLDGAPLDTAAEAVLVGVVLSFLLWVNPHVLRQRAFRAVTVALLVWKAATAATLAQDGWCLRFTSPVQLYRDMGQIPHAWDIRADWRTPVPQCSAVMTRGYDRLDSFPAWFYNLPPSAIGQPAQDSDRPPLVSLRLNLDGFLHAQTPGTLRLDTGRDVTARVSVDGQPVMPAASGVAIAAGLHSVSIEAGLIKEDWALMPAWNGRNLWSASVATLSPPSTLDLWLRPWGRFVPALSIAVLLWLATAAFLQRVRSVVALALASALAAAFSMAALSGRGPLMRVAPLLLLAPAVVRLPRRARNLLGACLLIGVPFLALFATLGAPQAGRFTFYTSGDDWWTFQRYAYRIFMQGYWLEGGQVTFWYQPLYRWIAGSLHMLFGDSSVGELFWDAACALAGACFAFRVTRVVAGFRWAVTAAALVLAVMTLGPPWYLFGRGLSEISSMGFIYAAALFAMRGRHGSWPHILMAGTLATLAFFTRLNNLPMMIALTAFAWPLRQPIADVYRPRMLVARVSRKALAGVLTVIALGLWMFTARTWYYTGIPSMLFGTQSGSLSVWQATDEGLSAIENVVGSVLMVLTMNDPPRLDVRALPLMAGVASALFGVVRVRPFDRLPLGVVALCLAGMSGALVARGSAYPGRFSVHLIPVTVALSVCAVSLIVRRHAGGGQPR